MGHELSIHRSFYRLQEDVTGLAKISKLLLTVENGDANKYYGMELDDTALEDLADSENLEAGGRKDHSCRYD